MKEVFFNEDGSLKINETIMNQPSFVKIMEDGVVTADELEEQSRRVISIFRKIEDTFNDEQKMLVQELLVESNVLNAIFKQHGMQVVME
ncbi:MAG: hypothetical protein J1F40_01555 [Prevotellaceae bacterium]|nr:hypothetical protein [Prevotellaceae bacterium]